VRRQRRVARRDPAAVEQLTIVERFAQRELERAGTRALAVLARLPPDEERDDDAGLAVEDRRLEDPAVGRSSPGAGLLLDEGLDRCRIGRRLTCGRVEPPRRERRPTLDLVAARAMDTAAELSRRIRITSSPYGRRSRQVH
jgi:hypothetical protein